MEPEFNVDVVIKTPYLDVGDQQYKCNLNWTVRTLKSYLSNVYPTKPTVENQRLIYFGQVLSDDLILKNIFMNEFKVQTIHMMCPPKINSKKILASNNLKFNKKTSETTNINFDNSNTNNFHSQGGEPRSMIEVPAYIQGYTVNPIYNNQQIAMMQQAYAHYMMQYFQYIESNRSNTENSPPQSEIPSPQSAVTNTSEIQPERNIDENAPHVPVHEINDPLANRDLIDLLYILIRFSILLSILYFYSSFRRCLFVIGITFFIYVYRRGFFTLRHERNRNDRRQQNSPRRNMIRYRRNRTRTSSELNSNQQGVQSNQVTTVKTFIASFFTSLIPEQLNPVDIN